MITKGEIIAISGLLNCMIGGTVLVLPLFGITAGLFPIPIISAIFCLFSVYSCSLMSIHLGKCNNVRKSILQHFNNHHLASVIYNLICSSATYFSLANYFILLLLQIQGLYQMNNLMAFLVSLFLLGSTFFLRVYSLGEAVLGLGFLSIVAYVFFLIWSFITAPTGPKQIPVIGQNFIDLSASLVMGYSIHDIVTQVLLKTTTNDKFQKVIWIVYVIAFLIYTFISYSGLSTSSIINRNVYSAQPQTIEDYFPKEQWQRKFIEGIYLLHMITAIPENTIIMKIRFLQVFKIEEGPKITLIQSIFYVCAVGSWLLFYLLNVKLATIIEINGSIIGVLYIFILPICIHLKCIYFSRHDQQGRMISIRQDEKGEEVEYYGDCGCEISSNSRLKRVGQAILIACILVAGVWTVCTSIGNLLYGVESQKESGL